MPYDVMLPGLPLDDYAKWRNEIRSCDVVAFAHSTSYWPPWPPSRIADVSEARGIAALQTPSCDCTHFGIVSLLPPWLSTMSQSIRRQNMRAPIGLVPGINGVPDRCRRWLIEATTPCVKDGPLSAKLGLNTDGKLVDAYDGRVYIGRFDDCDGIQAAADAWNNVGLPYAYDQIVALALGLSVGEIDGPKCMEYVCSGMVAEALKAGGANLLSPDDEQGVVEPVDLVQQMLYCPGARFYARLR